MLWSEGFSGIRHCRPIIIKHWERSNRDQWPWRILKHIQYIFLTDGTDFVIRDVQIFGGSLLAVVLVTLFVSRASFSSLVPEFLPFFVLDFTSHCMSVWLWRNVRYVTLFKIFILLIYFRCFKWEIKKIQHLSPKTFSYLSSQNMVTECILIKRRETSQIVMS